MQSEIMHQCKDPIFIYGMVSLRSIDLFALTSMSRICIIGAGAAGLAILKEITHSEEYKNGLWKVVDCFEERQDVGGIWLPSASSSVHPPFTPLYDSLTTNLPHPSKLCHEKLKALLRDGFFNQS